ncbi:hypothetical protein B0H11DRAFT_1904962 [Mycena galericulata]|nr:hypothetical protein B0H11DRAFT_1904962 [Mycena galericulata]
MANPGELLSANQTWYRHQLKQPMAATASPENSEIFLDAPNFYCVANPGQLLSANQTWYKHKLKQPVAATAPPKNPQIFVDARSMYTARYKLDPWSDCYCVADPGELLSTNQTWYKHKLKQPMAATVSPKNPQIFVDARPDLGELLPSNQTWYKHELKQPVTATGSLKYWWTLGVCM